MAEAWQEYQEEAATFFRSIGMTAETNATVAGVRTAHDVDVLVVSQFAGFHIRWIVECKHWRSPVSKLHVLALRGIVTDLGADRGILLAEKGYQSGALEAAQLTNVQLTSLADLRAPAEAQVYAMRVLELFDRVQLCRERYWNISKSERIDHGLRPDTFAVGYSGDHVISLLEDLLAKAMRAKFPISPSPLYEETFRLPAEYASVHSVCDLAESLIGDLESKLDGAERALTDRNEN